MAKISDTLGNVFYCEQIEAYDNSFYVGETSGDMLIKLILNVIVDYNW